MTREEVERRMLDIVTMPTLLEKLIIQRCVDVALALVQDSRAAALEEVRCALQGYGNVDDPMAGPHAIDMLTSCGLPMRIAARIAARKPEREGGGE